MKNLATRLSADDESSSFADYYAERAAQKREHEEAKDAERRLRALARKKAAIERLRGTRGGRITGSLFT